MVNPLDHWFRVPFGTRLRIPLMGLSGFRGEYILDPPEGIIWFPGWPGIGSYGTPFSGSSSPVFWIFYVFFCCFQTYWPHSSVVPYRVVFCDIICQVFISFFPEYLEMILSYSVAYPIKSHVYCSGYFLFCRSIHDTTCCCVVTWHWRWWL